MTPTAQMMSPVSEREASSSEEDVNSEDASSLTPTAQMMPPVSERDTRRSEEDVSGLNASSLTPTAQMPVAQKLKFLVHEVVVRSREKHNFRCPLKSPLSLIR